ncbi:MAG: FAD-dependent oxidoreductase [Acidobacteria bacterium]|nr:FAD-dependent oxidoreductase [Acidobacteriota bacterium]
MSDKKYDVVIIGGGPAGASAAIYTSRGNLKTALVDKSIRTGALAQAAKIVNYPGILEELSGLELLQRMRKQAEQFGARFLQATVMATDLRSDPKKIFTDKEGDLAAGAVIIATGASERKNKVSGEEEYLGKGVSYCATCDGAFFQGEEIAVVGDSDHALEEALVLTRYARQVHLAAPSSDLNAPPELLERATQESKIRLLRNHRLRRIEGNRFVRAAILQQPGHEEFALPVSGIFIYLQGNQPSLEFLSDPEIQGNRRCIAVDQDRATAIPGVFAVGDVVCTQLKQAVVAAAEGAIAAISADRYLNRFERVAPGRYY